MAIDIDSMQDDACNTGESAGTLPSPEISRDCAFGALRRLCADCDGVGVDYVYRVITALDAHGGRRELGDLVEVIGDAIWPLSIIEAMIDGGLIRFVPGHAFDAAIPVERIA